MAEEKTWAEEMQSWDDNDLWRRVEDGGPLGCDAARVLIERGARAFAELVDAVENGGDAKAVLTKLRKRP